MREWLFSIEASPVEASETLVERVSDALDEGGVARDAAVRVDLAAGLVGATFGIDAETHTGALNVAVQEFTRVLALEQAGATARRLSIEREPMPA